MRAELAGPRRLAHEAAFLPAALSLQETPVHPAPRRALWVLMAMLAAALAWSWFGQIDVVAVAQGRVVVSDRSKVVQSLEAGVVRAIHVREGDRVAAGQLLIELDPTQARADRLSVAEQAQAAHAEAARAEVLLQALRRSGDLSSPEREPGVADRAPRLPASMPAAAAAGRERAQAQADAEWRDITARLARLDAEAARRRAEQRTLREAVAKLQALLPLARRREADVLGLAQQGYMASHAGQDRTRERIELELDLATQQARQSEAEAALAEAERGRAAYLAETRRALADRAAKARLEIAQLRQQGAKTAQRESLTRLTAPVAGTVQQLVVHTAGGVVTPAQPLMVVVPEGAEVVAEVVLENKDIGFVHAGQDVAVKVETFSFTRYGTLPGRVQWVSADAVVDDKRGAIFPARVLLGTATLNVDGKTVALVQGMNVTAEVRTGRRRLIDYLLSPVQQAMSESMGER